METNIVHCGDIIENMKKHFEDKSINSFVTSVPYYQKRDYKWDGQWGLEPTPEQYLDNMMLFMAEAHRTLTDDGTVWINIGDTYNTKSGNMTAKNYVTTMNSNMNDAVIPAAKYAKCKKYPKGSLLMIPSRFAIRAIEEQGWILRNNIAWIKKNAFPESVEDRFSCKWEHILFFTKKRKYYFNLDAVKDARAEASKQRLKYKWNGNKNNESREFIGSPVGYKTHLMDEGRNPGDVNAFWDDYKDMTIDQFLEMIINDYNQSDVLDINTKSSSLDHTAMFNSELILKPILAGCPPDGIVCDPFCGTGKTLETALKSGRRAIGIEGSPKNHSISERVISSFTNSLF